MSSNPRESVRGIGITSKLFGMAAIALIPVGILGALFYSHVSQQRAAVQREMAGIEYCRAVKEVARAAVEFRRLTGEYLAGKKELRPELQNAQAQVDDALRAVEGYEKRADTGNATAFAEVKSQWSAVKDALEKARGDDRAEAAQLMKSQAELVGRARALFAAEALASRLRLDPDSAAGYLIDGMSYLLDDADELAQLQSAAATATTPAKPAKKKTTLTSDEAAALNRLLGRTGGSEEAYQTAWAGMIRARPEIHSQLATANDERYGDRSRFVSLVADKVIKPTDIETTPLALTNDGQKAVARNFEFYEQLEPFLVAELNLRQSAANRPLYFGIAAVIAGFALTLLAAFLIARGMVRQTDALVAALAQAEAGDSDARASVTSSDEIGRVAVSLNKVLANPRANTGSPEDRLPRALVKLLKDAVDITQGDLTKQLEVSGDAVGAVAKAFNDAVEQMRHMVGDVLDAADRVDASAAAVYAIPLAQTPTVVPAAATTAMNDLTASVQSLSEQSTQSAALLQTTLAHVRAGLVAVRSPADSATRLRDRGQLAARRFRRLSELSQEIVPNLQLLDDLADRTSLVAMNAALRAATAGTAGGEFATAAAEVERLAERSTEATRKIGTLLKAIQFETNEATATLEKGWSDSGEGSKLLHPAGPALAQIDTATQQLAGVVQHIATTAAAQARGAETLAKTLGDMVAAQGAAAPDPGAVAERLTALAEELRRSVEAFQVPKSGLSSRRLRSPGLSGKGAARPQPLSSIGTLED